MSKENKNWWENRVLRSVDNLKLWHDNPRLDPANKLITVRDYVEELIADPTDEQKFIDLMKSIATRGFLSFDPVVVCLFDNSRYKSNTCFVAWVTRVRRDNMVHKIPGTAV